MARQCSQSVFQRRHIRVPQTFPLQADRSGESILLEAIQEWQQGKLSFTR